MIPIRLRRCAPLPHRVWRKRAQIPIELPSVRRHEVAYAGTGLVIRVVPVIPPTTKQKYRNQWSGGGISTYNLLHKITEHIYFH